MAIHEKSLIETERLLEHDSLVVDGVDVSGQWNTMITPRTIVDYDDDFEAKIQSYVGGEYVHRCWQCGSCTNSCTMYAQNVQFNPRYWIYLTRLGLTDELIKDKDIIWQCVSCNKCTNICPKDVKPEGVMKALSHWLEEEGITEKSPSRIFDEEFTDQVYDYGRIEDSKVMKNFFKESGQPLVQGWLVEFTKRMIKRLPVAHLVRLGTNVVFTPKTKSWGKTGEVLKAYVREQKEAAHG
ncbi:CoB--CoM heterodisulfide reductase subunit C [Thioalkalivibrio nitratireducens DSM 14787]|uniref:CoB--CoM heterodisulfide reductase subunit C n=1 Tax=Thioalkalivibrio nitratireducens (strain DSM 14787 / UNIQEM 213 / ALEN2) TaxID=1255043 RepID=L0E0X3_THIND|nr:4Fe-4S dicluster domain-containing protein [Thioalkalivibrio nitratireducens]AGA34882.1 CoB--CoM heterodisulfide reductase subunit C [Thioalkalivibrio nitratireducens DSM 14787]